MVWHGHYDSLYVNGETLWPGTFHAEQSVLELYGGKVEALYTTMAMKANDALGDLDYDHGPLQDVFGTSNVVHPVPQITAESLKPDYSVQKEARCYV